IFCLLFSGLSATAQPEQPLTTTTYFDDAVYQLFLFQNQLHLLLGDGIVYAYEADGSLKEVFSLTREEMYSTIVSDDQGLYVLQNDEKLLLTRIMNEKGERTKEILYEGAAVDSAYLQNVLLRNNHLLFLTASGTFRPEGDEQIITSINLENGEKKETVTQNVILFDVMEDGKYILLQNKRVQWDLVSLLVSLRPDTGQSEELVTLGTSQYISGLTYDEKSKTAYLCDRNQIYSWRKVSGYKTAGAITAGDTGNIVVIDKDFISLRVDEHSIVIKNVNPEYKSQQKTLVIQDPIGRGEEYKSFIEAYPETTLVFHRNDSQSNEDRFIQDMLTKSDEIDVYLLYSPNLLKQIKDKEYALDISQSLTLTKLIKEMYPPFQQAFMQGEKIFAFPKNTFFISSGYNKTTFDSLDLPLPTTYEEYLSFCIDWIDHQAASHPDILFDPFITHIDLPSFFKNYADERIKNGLPIKYNTPDMTRLLEKYFALQTAFKQADLPKEGSTYLFATHDVLFGSSEPLLLSFDPALDPIISPVSDDQSGFSYFVVNPYGKNLETTLTFLESYEPSRMEVEVALLYQTADQPIESKFYLEEVALMEKNLTSLEKALSEASQADQKPLQEEIDLQKKAIENYKAESHWAISQEALDDYQSLLPFVYINTFNPFVTLFANDPALLNPLLENNPNIPGFLQELDSKIDMILLEAGIPTS
ncbi:MAG: hypothetical protein GX786_07940, partial [Clostridiales bacterium]|nr:hypothetical protein [Clostridiales bacterium]